MRALMLRERLDRDASEWETRSERVFGTFWNTRTDAAYHTRLLECRGAGELVGEDGEAVLARPTWSFASDVFLPSLRLPWGAVLTETFAFLVFVLTGHAFSEGFLERFPH